MKNIIYLPVYDDGMSNERFKEPLYVPQTNPENKQTRVSELEYVRDMLKKPSAGFKIPKNLIRLYRVEEIGGIEKKIHTESIPLDVLHEGRLEL